MSTVSCMPARNPQCQGQAFLLPVFCGDKQEIRSVKDKPVYCQSAGCTSPLQTLHLSEASQSTRRIKVGPRIRLARASDNLCGAGQRGAAASPATALPYQRWRRLRMEAALSSAAPRQAPTRRSLAPAPLRKTAPRPAQRLRRLPQSAPARQPQSMAARQPPAAPQQGERRPRGEVATVWANCWRLGEPRAAATTAAAATTTTTTTRSAAMTTTITTPLSLIHI